MSEKENFATFIDGDNGLAQKDEKPPIDKESAPVMQSDKVAHMPKSIQ